MSSGIFGIDRCFFVHSFFCPLLKAVTDTLECLPFVRSSVLEVNFDLLVGLVSATYALLQQVRSWLSRRSRIAAFRLHAVLLPVLGADPGSSATPPVLLDEANEGGHISSVS